MAGALGGWLMHLYLASIPEADAHYRMVYNAAAADEADLRLENTGTLEAEFAVDASAGGCNVETTVEPVATAADTAVAAAAAPSATLATAPLT